MKSAMALAGHPTTCAVIWTGGGNFRFFRYASVVGSLAKVNDVVDKLAHLIAVRELEVFAHQTIPLRRALVPAVQNRPA
jgi:hypothetical protein